MGRVMGLHLIDPLDPLLGGFFNALRPPWYACPRIWSIYMFRRLIGGATGRFAATTAARTISRLTWSYGKAGEGIIKSWGKE